MNKKRVLALILALVMISGMLAGCGKSGADGEENAVEISYWIPLGEDSTFYDSYDDNPCVRYMETKSYAGSKIDLKFLVPAASSQQENFNTLLSTGEYADLMDMAVSSTGAVELYEEGIVWDLTPYMEEHMPNYMAVLERYPELAAMTYSLVNGERKILQIYSLMHEPMHTFKGTLYRRDWVAKYGTHPETGVAFTYGYKDPANKDSWYDDVVFPSGGTDPLYISDWEWMFEIFTKALADLGIEDGYCYSPYYVGFEESGELFSGFGGGTPLWYQDKEGNMHFGGTEESMRAYMECLNAWYEKGWLNKSFAENSQDASYAVDSTRVYQGKVGLWVGRRSEIGSELDQPEFPAAEGMVVYGAKIPINDMYGDPSTQGKEPYSLYQYSRLRGSLTVTDKVTEEELPVVLAFLDSLYTAEGGALIALGLTKEQSDSFDNEIYAKYNLTNGSYYVEEGENGEKKYIYSDQQLCDDYTLQTALCAKRLNIGYYAPGFVEALNNGYKDNIVAAMEQWDTYPNTGYPDKVLLSHFSLDESAQYNKVHANVVQFMSVNVPKFIRGELDVHSDSDWGDYTKMLGKYGPDKVSKIYGNLYDLLS